MKKLLLIASITILSGCDEIQPDTKMSETSPPSDTRIKVDRIGVFADGLAYNHMRGIYIITDTKTGEEFVGISGIGISELGSHTRQVGKTIQTIGDER